jgi:hypothetical protein
MFATKLKQLLSRVTSFGVEAVIYVVSVVGILVLLWGA